MTEEDILALRMRLYAIAALKAYESQIAKLPEEQVKKLIASDASEGCGSNKETT